MARRSRALLDLAWQGKRPIEMALPYVRAFDENKVRRGKTTDKSSPGSFAPQNGGVKGVTSPDAEARLAQMRVKPSEIDEMMGIAGVAVSAYGGSHDGPVMAYVPDDLTQQKSFPFEEVFREFRMSKAGDLTCYNVSLKIKPEFQGKGLGTRTFAQQVKALVARGFKSIETEAARSSAVNSRGALNGYYTWARLGYDADLQPGFVRFLKQNYPSFKAGNDGIHDAKRVSDLMRTAKGRKVWKEHGYTFDGTFDLTEGSLSRRVLDAYMAAKRHR
jgi:GNAT superfamily N-acetyltransferase